MFRIAATAYKRKDFRRKSQHQTHVQVRKVKTYQLSRLVKVMVANEHPVFGHSLERLPIQIAGEWDAVLLSASRHRHSEKSGLEVTHAYDRRPPLVKGAPTANDFPGTLWTRSHRVHRRTILLLRQNIRAQPQPVR